jgi:GNAT superfamily N-acetyltransferase
MSSRELPDPLQTIHKLIQERYSDAAAIFWAGSISQNQGTSASDLDLVIVFKKLPNAYREAFIYEGWPIDAFINDPDTLRYSFEESRTTNGISGLGHMILNGIELLAPNDFSTKIKALTREALRRAPAEWPKNQIDKERFLITDILDDIKYPASREEQIASAAHLFEPLIQFYFRAQKKWCASGKSIIRYLKIDNPDLALEFTKSFEALFQAGDAAGVESVVKKILEPYGGFLWDGFKSNAPKEAKLVEPIFLSEINDKYQCYLEEGENTAITNFLSSGLKTYNQTVMKEYSQEPFTIYVKDLSNEIIGGCDGFINGDNHRKICFVIHLYVNQKSKNQGCGGEILNQMEQYARTKNCQKIMLWTEEFQAKKFYEVSGYSINSTEESVTYPGFKAYLMEKILGICFKK